MVGETISGATFSPDRLYRYSLWRIWDRHKPMVMVIGLNPSTADEIRNDPTIVRCINFGKSWGYGGLWFANMFGFRSANPDRLRQVDDPVGEGNDEALRMMRKLSERVVVAWGHFGDEFSEMVADVLDLMGKPVYCLGVTKEGQPRHPLYLPADAELDEYLPAPQFRG